MGKYILWIFTLFIFSDVPLKAQEPLSLAQAIEMGLQNSYQLKSSGVLVSIAGNGNNWAEAGRLPVVNATVGFNNSFLFQENPASVLLEQTNLNNALNPGLNLNWLLYNGQRVKLTKEQLQQFENQSMLNEQGVVESLVQQISLAYYQTLLQQEQLAVLDQVLALSRDRIDYEKTRKEFGQAGTFDLLQTRDAYLSDSANYVLQLNNYQAAMRNLNLSMQQEDINKIYRLTDSLFFEPVIYSFEQLENELFSQNNELKLQQLNRDLARLNTQLREAAQKPTISLGSGLSYNASLANGEQKFSFSPEPQTIDGARANSFNAFVNVSASYQLYDGGIRKRAVENAKKQEMVAQFTVENVKQQLKNQLANLLASFEAQKNVAAVRKQSMSNARENLKIAAERFKGGLISSFDYRSVQLSFINAGQSLSLALFNLKSTEIELLRLTGKLAAQTN